MLAETADYKIISCTPSVITTKLSIQTTLSVAFTESMRDSIKKSHLGFPLCQRHQHKAHEIPSVEATIHVTG